MNFLYSPISYNTQFLKKSIINQIDSLIERNFTLTLKVGNTDENGQRSFSVILRPSVL